MIDLKEYEFGIGDKVLIENKKGCVFALQIDEITTKVVFGKRLDDNKSIAIPIYTIQKLRPLWKG